MAAIDNVKEAVFFEEPYLFLDAYIAYLKEGYDVRFPDRSDSESIRIQWHAILTYLQIDASPFFMDRLTAFWVLLMPKYDGEWSADQLDDIYTLIKQTWFSSKETDTSHETVDDILHKMGDMRQSVQLSLSDEAKINRYYQTETPMTDAKRLEEIDRAIRRKNANLFIEIWLSVHLKNFVPHVPRTLILDEISRDWEQIIVSNTQRKPSSKFLQSLTGKWFFLVHVLGVPLTVEKVRDMHYFVTLNPKKLELHPERAERFFNHSINTKLFQQGGKY